MSAPPTRIAGIVLAAGAGTRAGGPKALRRDADGVPWLHRSVAALRDGGCTSVVVVLGAGADRARELVPEGADAIVAGNWADGLSASLRAGLAAVPASTLAVVVTLVDLHALPAAAVARILAAPLGPGTLRRAVYAGRPGHPVLIGARHLEAAAASATGDRGAGLYLAAQGAEPVELSGLWDGADDDDPA